MLRKLTKTAKNCLVYFTIDDTISVLDTKHISMVEGGKPIEKRAKVLITLHGQRHEAYVLELSGNHRENCFNSLF